VIYDSSIALLQGLYPPSNAHNITLANGTVVESPLGGYQYVPIESVELAEDVSLEGHADCNTWNTRVTNLYASQEFTAKAAEAAPFLNAIKPFLDNRTVSLQNMYNIFDFLNVQSIHNASFHNSLPPSLFAQAYDLANWHEWLLFSDPSSGGIGNIDIYTMLPSVLSGLQRIANHSDTLKIHYSAISYKPFISLFNLTSVTPPTSSNANDTLAGLVDYASSVVLEVVNVTGTGEVGVRMLFKNGTNDQNFLPISGGLLGSSGLIPVGDFVNAFQPLAINTTLQWCNACSNQQDRGCAAYFQSANTSAASPSTCHSNNKVSNVGAGFIGAGVTLALVAGLMGVAFLLGFLHLGKRRGSGSVASSEGKASH